MNVYQKLDEMGIRLPQATQKAGIYSRLLPFGENLVYVSGTGPAIGEDQGPVGKLGSDLTLEQGQDAARRCAINILANLHAELGDLNRIRRFVKLLAFVASDDSFMQQPLVANGASKLLLDVFGEKAGLPARSAIGVNVLPGNIPVEIEALLELEA